MIIPKRKICDICGRDLSCNIVYYTIKSDLFCVAGGGACHAKNRHHICSECVLEFKKWMAMKGEAE